MRFWLWWEINVQLIIQQTINSMLLHFYLNLNILIMKSFRKETERELMKSMRRRLRMKITKRLRNLAKMRIQKSIKKDSNYLKKQWSHVLIKFWRIFVMMINISRQSRSVFLMTMEKSFKVMITSSKSIPISSKMISSNILKSKNIKFQSVQKLWDKKN